MYGPPMRSMQYGTAANPNYYPYLHIYNDGSTFTNQGTFTIVGNESITSTIRLATWSTVPPMTSSTR